MPLSPDDVANVAFNKPPFGKRGYNEAEVDDFLDQLEHALRHPDQHTALTAQRASTIVFGPPVSGRRGYNMGEVDDFLDQAVEALGGPPVSAPVSTDTGEQSQGPRTGFLSSLFRRPPEI